VAGGGGGADAAAGRATGTPTSPPPPLAAATTVTLPMPTARGALRPRHSTAATAGSRAVAAPVAPRAASPL